mmetsp:Transcript_43171/g.105609  ORF Transcript_43171/g.105609 Transcript_43171/m.105609 type:complete len:206 (+) Transcript_43171:1070-1687(+)
MLRCCSSVTPASASSSSAALLATSMAAADALAHPVRSPRITLTPPCSARHFHSPPPTTSRPSSSSSSSHALGVDGFVVARERAAGDVSTISRWESERLSLSLVSLTRRRPGSRSHLDSATKSEREVRKSCTPPEWKYSGAGEHPERRLRMICGYPIDGLMIRIECMSVRRVLIAYLAEACGACSGGSNTHHATPLSSSSFRHSVP